MSLSLSTASPPLNLLGMAPIVVLLFMKRPQESVDARPVRPVCPKCDTLHSRDQSYCVSCGWELARSYPGETSTGEEQVSTPLGSQNHEPMVATADTTPVHPATLEAEPVAEAGTTSRGEATPPEPAHTDATEELTGGPVESPEEAPLEPEVRRHRGVPTASGMTQWGIDLFDLGRVQESIDQFTKAIALDPNFKMAWERRAESYAKLGRGEQAAEDRRRLRAINATPSAG